MMAMRVYLEFREGKSSKFWEVVADGKAVTTRWGRIGANGQSKTQSCASATAARELADELAAEKQNKGYACVDTASGVPAPARAADDAAVVPERASAQRGSAITDLTKLRRAMAAMNQGKVVALANAGPTQSGGYEDAAKEIHRRGGDSKAYEIIFWHKQSHRTAFQGGALVGDLHLHWSGDLAAFARRLREALDPEFEVVVPHDDTGAFRIRRATTPDDVDPTDTPAALAFMDRVREGSMRGSDSDATPRLQRILGDGEPRAAMYALFLMAEDADASDVEIALSRVDEIAALRAGAQCWQDPSYALGYLLGAMRRVAHPRYAELRESWKIHRRRVFRDAVDHEL
jgi:predicted DNA-binding WGR domain protein